MSIKDNYPYAINKNHKYIIQNGEFQHHGIKGQKWGVITKNVGVNYVPIGQRSSSSNNKLSPADQMRKIAYGRYTLGWDIERALTDNYQKFRIPSPLNEEGFHKDRLLTKGGRIKQLVKQGAYNAALAAMGYNAGSKAIKGVMGLHEANTLIKEAQKNGFDFTKSPRYPEYKQLEKVALNKTLLNTGIGVLAGAYIGIKVYDTANKYHEYSKDDVRREGLKIDKKTGLHLRNDKDSDADDLKNVNPGYRKFTGDTNCPGCAIATDLRARGYDVRAKDFQGIMLRTSISNAYKGNNELTIAHGDKIMSDNYYNAKIGKNFDCAKNTLKALSKQPEGSRGILMIEYGFAGGHVTTYRVENKKAKIYEGQLGKVLSDAEANRLLSLCYQTSYIRTDNLKPNFDVCKEVVK